MKLPKLRNHPIPKPKSLPTNTLQRRGLHESLDKRTVPHRRRLRTSQVQRELLVLRGGGALPVHQVHAGRVVDALVQPLRILLGNFLRLRSQVCPKIRFHFIPGSNGFKYANLGRFGCDKNADKKRCSINY